MATSPEENEDSREIAASYKRLGEVAWFNDRKLELLHATFKALNHAERAGSEAEIINGFGSVAIVASFANMKGVADRYMERCAALGEATDNVSHKGRSDLLVALYAVQLADWPRAKRHADRATALFARLGDRFRWESMRSMRGYIHLCKGEFHDANRCWREVLDSAANGALQSRVFAQCGMMATALTANDATTIASAIPAIEDIIAQRPQAGDSVYCHGVLAAAYVRTGGAAKSMMHADAALDLIGSTPPSTYYTLWGMAGIAEACIAAARTGGTADRRKAKNAVALLKKFSRMIPMAKPLSARWSEEFAAMSSH